MLAAAAQRGRGAAMSKEIEGFVIVIGDVVSYGRRMQRPAGNELGTYYDRLMRVCEQHQAAWGQLGQQGFESLLPPPQRSYLNSCLGIARGKVAGGAFSLLDMGQVLNVSYDAIQTLNALPGTPTIGAPKPPPPPPPGKLKV